LTGKNRIIEFYNHSGMVNTKFNNSVGWKNSQTKNTNHRCIDCMWPQ